MNKKFLALIIAVLVLLIAVVGLSLTQDSSPRPEGPFPLPPGPTDPTRVIQDDANPDISTSAPAPGTTPENRPENVLTPLVGTQNGTGVFSASELSFPEVTFQLEESDLFSFTAAGLDLATLDNQNLQLNGEFPLLEITGAGGADITGEESVTLEITSLTPTFYLLTEEGFREEVAAPAQEQLRAALNSAGFTIPEASETNAVSIPVTVTETETGVLVKNTPDTELEFEFNLN